MKTELYSHNGEFIAAAQIPDFIDPPDVVIWGERVFRISDQSDPIEFGNIEDITTVYYTEAFTYTIPRM